MNASQRGKSNRRKGLDAERAVARYLRTVGFPGAERAVRTGYTGADRSVADPGDITGVPGIVWQVKSVAREDLAGWMSEVEEQATAANADLGVLIQRRPGKADPARWWAWVQIVDIGFLFGGRSIMHRHRRYPVRMELGHLVPLLHQAGYGTSEGRAA